jgi:hypothetical protein
VNIRSGLSAVLITFAFLHAHLSGAEIAPMSSSHSPRYYWSSQPVGHSARLLTLFCDPCGDPGAERDTVPLLSVLRDTLGDNSRENDRIAYVWLLGVTHQSFTQRLLAAVPFFYWRVEDGSTHADGKRLVKPLMDLTRPENPMIVQGMRTALQWTALDPLSMPVRATSRAYRTNEVTSERSHLEEAIGYLRQAPESDSGEGLTKAEKDTVLARLTLRKRLLGGLVGDPEAPRVGQQEEAEAERVRSRNWDLLLSFAERTGLVFESLDISGTSGEYGLLWFPADTGTAEPTGSSHDAVWKALNLRNPWMDSRLRAWDGPAFERSLDSNGSLLPAGITGFRTVKLIPLGVYSLDYPKFPLLMVDFREKRHVRLNEMTQRTVNEITAGIIGISHFANWYYYVGASAYDFVVSRHGKGMDAPSRLDCYSRFRVDLALDRTVDPRLRSLLQSRMDSLSLNPLQGSPQHEVQVAAARYTALLGQASSGVLEKQLDKTRRSELSNFGTTQRARAARALLSRTSFNLLPPRRPADKDLLSSLDRARRVQADLSLLHAAVNSGPSPEVTYDSSRMRTAVQELSQLLPDMRSKKVRIDAVSTLSRLEALTADRELQADCSLLLATIQKKDEFSTSGIATAPKVFTNSVHPRDFPK